MLRLNAAAAAALFTCCYPYAQTRRAPRGQDGMTLIYRERSSIDVGIDEVRVVPNHWQLLFDDLSHVGRPVFTMLWRNRMRS